MNHVFPIEPASSSSLAFGWGLTLVLLLSALGSAVLPLAAGWIVRRSSAGSSKTARTAVGWSSVLVWLTCSLPLLVAGGAIGRSVYAASTATFNVTPTSLVLDGDWWGREIPRSGLRAREASVVDLDSRPDLWPTVRTFGTGLPGYGSGWFRNREGAALAYLTRTRQTVVVPTTFGYMLLLTPKDPEGLVAALQDEPR